MTLEKVQAVVEAARQLVSSADEFLPEYPEAVGEYLDALIDKVDALGEKLNLPPGWDNPTCWSWWCEECRSFHPDTTPCISGRVKASEAAPA